MLLLNWKAHNRLNFDLFYGLLFLFFLTLHADQLSVLVFGYTVRLNNVLTLLLCLLLILRFRTRLFTLERKFAYALLAITTSVLLSACFSPYKLRSMTFLGWYGWTLVCYLLVPYFLIIFCDHKKVVSLYGLSFVVVGIYAFLQLLISLFGVSDPFAQQRILGMIVRPNAFAYEPSFYALYMTPFVILCNAHFITSPQEEFFFPKQLNFVKVLLINTLFLLSTSTSTLFAYGLFFVLAFLLFKEKEMRKRSLKLISSFLVAGLSLFILAPFLIREFYLKFFFFGFLEHHSFYQRWIGIKNTWHIFLENLCVGVGLGGCPPYLYTAWQAGDQQYIFFDQHYDLSQINILKNFEPMNVFTEILASLGILGCLAFCFLTCVLLQKARQAFKQAPYYTLNLCVALFVMFCVLQFNQGILRTYIWTHLAITYALLEKAGQATFPLPAHITA